MSEKEANWFSVMPDSYEFRCTNYGWFPTDVIMTVSQHKYTDSNNLGITISGNMGTASIAIKNAREAISLLQNAGYNIETEAGAIF
jgi:hypothetical protein